MDYLLLRTIDHHRQNRVWEGTSTMELNSFHFISKIYIIFTFLRIVFSNSDIICLSICSVVLDSQVDSKSAFYSGVSIIDDLLGASLYSFILLMVYMISYLVLSWISLYLQNVCLFLIQFSNWNLFDYHFSLCWIWF